MSLPGISSRTRSAEGRSSVPSATSSLKGKGKAPQEVDDTQTGENGHHSTSPQDYDEAMRAALVDQDENDNGGDGSGQGAQDDDAETTFIYNGRDDEDTQEFIKDASLEHRSYQERLRGVLEGDEDDAPVEDTSSLTSSTSPGARIQEPINSPLQMYQDRSMTPTSPSIRSEDDFSMSQASSSPMRQQQRHRHLPPRRPPMNPLISRLRSTSGMSSMSPSTSFRSISHSSSVNSLRDIEGLNGFANGSPNSSFLAESGRDKPANGLDSRSSINGEYLLPAHRSEAARSDAGETEGGQLRHPDGVSAAGSQGRQSIPKPSPPLVDPIRWTHLRRLSQLLHPHPAKASIVGGKLGEITAMAASGVICLGTSTGWTLVFDYSQALKCICGNEEIASSAGKVTSVALSSDQTFAAVGHESGFIYLYALAKPQVPARIVPPVSIQAVQQGKAEGHLAGSNGSQSAIVQLGFVGSRHTAIVSADSNGLAFYHSLGKVLGLANTDVLRILGRYPQDLAASNMKASPILAMQALPLGTQPHATDDYCLVAILTPAKIVVAGLKPSAKTWWRALNLRHAVAKPANGHSVGGVAGALAWLPSIDGADPHLAYTWDDALHIVRVEHEVKRSARDSKTADPKAVKEMVSKSLRFVTVSRGSKATEDGNREGDSLFSASESTLAMQWYNHRSLACMSHTAIEVFDIATSSRIEKASLYARELELADRMPAQQAMKIYRSKIFLMCKDGLRVGSLLSWTDRILTLVDRGQLLQAIELALAFYDGTALSCDGSLAVANAILGLPKVDEQRQALVGPKLQEVLMASVDYVFSEDRMRDDTHVDTSGRHRGVDRTSLFETLVEVTIRVGLAIKDLSFLFEDLYERYTFEGIVGIFLHRLEPFILQNLIRDPPVTVGQQILQRHEDRGELAEAEALIWHLDPACLDVDQAIGLCTRHGLYDALIYTYTKALADFVGPFVVLLGVLREVHEARLAQFEEEMADFAEGNHADYFGETTQTHSDRSNVAAYKIYAYLADILVGLAHPNKEPLEDSQALLAKVSLYTFLFSGRARAYPEGSRHTVKTTTGEHTEPTYPYLRLLLAFDTEAMLGCLDVALEDPYLNEEASGRTPDRQQIMLILLDVMRSSGDSGHAGYFTSEDRTFLNIFIARNLPKYSQFIQLAEPTLKSVLLDLIRDADVSTSEDRQLAAEFLLSAYTPVYDDNILQLLDEARFYRILASIYKSKKAWKNLADVQIRDAQGDPAIFDTLHGTATGLKGPEKREMADAILMSAVELALISADDFAIFVDRDFPDDHSAMLEKLAVQPTLQMAYLASLLEPKSDLLRISPHISSEQKVQYIALLCDHESPRIVSYLAKDSTLEEEAVLPVLKEKEAFAAIIWFQASKGHLQESLATTSTTLEERMELLSASASASGGAELPGIRVDQIVAATRVAITVCCEQGKQEKRVSVDQAGENWFSLLAAVLRTVESATAIVNATSNAKARDALQPIFGLTAEILAALTTSSASGQLPFSRLVRRLMDGSKSNTYIQYKDIIHSMLGTYRYESDFLRGANALTTADVYEHVVEVEAERRKGWRPSVSGVCEACGKPVWAQADPAEGTFSSNLVVKSSSGIEVSEKLKGRPSVRRRPSLKGKEPSWIDEGPPERSTSTKGKSVVVFRGGAICHASCLE